MAPAFAIWAVEKLFRVLLDNPQWTPFAAYPTWAMRQLERNRKCTKRITVVPDMSPLTHVVQTSGDSERLLNMNLEETVIDLVGLAHGTIVKDPNSYVTIDNVKETMRADRGRRHSLQQHLLPRWHPAAWIRFRCASSRMLLHMLSTAELCHRRLPY
jgi:hypothetical protein